MGWIMFSACGKCNQAKGATDKIVGSLNWYDHDY